MALEYRLQIKTKISLFNFVESYLYERNISFSKEIIKNGINIYLYEVLGFMISIFSSDKIYFEYLINNNETFEEEWDYSNDIYIRFDKSFDNLHARLNMIDMCVYILNNTKDDAKLLFNGDILVLEKKKGIISINKNFGFWNSVDLIAKIEHM